MSWTFSIGLATKHELANGVIHRINQFWIDPDGLEDAEQIVLTRYHAVIDAPGDALLHYRKYLKELKDLGWEYDADYGISHQRAGGRLFLTFLNCPLSNHEILDIVQTKFPPESVDLGELTQALFLIMNCK